MTASNRDVALARLAATQQGVLSRTQIRQLGGTPNFVDRRVQNGIYVHVADGVVAIAGSPPTWRRSVMASVLSCGPGAAASHFTAAHLHGLVSRRPDRIDVTTHRPLRKHRPWNAHSSRDLLRHHVTDFEGIPLTTPARTVLDIAGANPWLTERLADRAVREGLMSYRDLGLLVAEVARRGRSGVVVCRRLVESRLDWNDRSESEFEDGFAALLLMGGVPLPEPQVEVFEPDGRRLCRLDYGDGPTRTAIFLDGYQWHSDRMMFQRDRRIRNRLAAMGWNVYAYTWWDVEFRKEAVLAELREALTRVA